MFTISFDKNNVFGEIIPSGKRAMCEQIDKAANRLGRGALCKKLIACMLISVLTIAVTPQPVTAMDFVVAGVPRESASKRDFPTLFKTLMSNGIHNFFPTFQYQEVPTSRSLGFETDFTVPCSRNDPGFAAIRATGMKLVLPAELVYPHPARIGRGSIENDPLSRIIACAGRENISAISNYDEAVFQGVAINHVKAFYERVKKIDPSLPVIMVHGPIATDRPEFSSSSGREKYLNEVQRFSAYGDIVGFDVYPVPAMIAKLASPLSDGNIVDASRAISDYGTWMQGAFPDKRRLMVLQGFAYSDLYEESYLKENVPAELLALINPPSSSQIESMVRQAKDTGVEMIVWWGQAALVSASQAPWPGILSTSKAFHK